MTDATSSRTAPVAAIPIILLTGFLGSGKTTLLRAALDSPLGAGTAVVVNELGEIGLDQHLLWQAAGTTVPIENGCICCSVRDDLIGALEQLFWQRLHREVPRFARVVIETTGLAEPDHVAAMLCHGLVGERYALQAIVTTIDGVAGLSQLAQHPECVDQVRATDQLIITKADRVSETDLHHLHNRLETENPRAAIVQSGFGALAINALLGISPSRPAREKIDKHDRHASRSHTDHSEAQRTTLRLSRPVDRAALERAIATLSGRNGARLLRIKGLVILNGDPRPHVVAWTESGLAVRPEPDLDRAASDRALVRVKAGGWLTVITRNVDDESIRAAVSRDIPLA